LLTCTTVRAGPERNTQWHTPNSLTYGPTLRAL
jgi:hypothetical protein